LVGPEGWGRERREWQDCFYGLIQFHNEWVDGLLGSIYLCCERACRIDPTSDQPELIENCHAYCPSLMAPVKYFHVYFI
jgi:hypothetical protein